MAGKVVVEEKVLLMHGCQQRSDQPEPASQSQPLRCLRCCPQLGALCSLLSGRGTGHGSCDGGNASNFVSSQIAIVAPGYTVAETLGTPVSVGDDEAKEDTSALPMSRRLTAYAAALKSEAVELKRAGDVEAAIEKFTEAKAVEREALAMSMREATR